MNSLFQNGKLYFYLLIFFMLVCVLPLFNGASKAFAAQKIESSALRSVSLINLSDGTGQLQLGFSQTAPEPRVFILLDPARLVLDFPNVTDQFKQKSELIKQVVASGLVKGINTSAAQDKTRVTLYFKQTVDYKIMRQGNYIAINLAKKVQPPITTSPNIFSNQQLNQVDFRKGTNGSGQIVFKMSNPNVNVDLLKQGQRLVINLKEVHVPASIQKRYDVTDFGTPIKSFTVMSQGPNTRVVADVSGYYEQVSYVLNNQLIIDVKSATTASSYDNFLTKPNYTGKRISLNFQDIKVRAILQVIAEFTGLNIVTSDQVKGNITLRLKEVPWDQALDIILKSQGLAKRQYGNVMLIAPVEELALREKQELQAQQQVADLAPIQSSLIQINYGKASDFAALLKDKSNTLLSSRGAVSVDNRTNTIWVQDTDAKITQIRDFLQRLDVPVRQVLIEARIVVMNKKYEEDFGIRFGVNQPGHLGGNLNAASNFANGTPINATNAADRLNFNLPAINDLTKQPAATVGLAMMRLGNLGALLDVELSALETNNEGQVLASPRLVTTNQQAATIQQGEEIPYQESTSSGATSTSFKKAVLSLIVTPQITPDNRLILDLKVNQDARSPSKEVNGVPAIDTRQITTKVQINNGETLVLGGVYTKTKQNNVARIPFLSALPLLGNLFKNTQIQEQQQELLIFVTPKIIESGAIDSL